MAGLQDLQDRVLGLSRAQTIDRITGLQDYKIYRMDCLKLNRALTMDWIAGFTG
jgi:hypothetical protein